MGTSCEENDVVASNRLTVVPSGFLIDHVPRVIVVDVGKDLLRCNVD